VIIIIRGRTYILLLDGVRVELEVNVFDSLQVDSAKVSRIAASFDQLLSLVQNLLTNENLGE